jgi:predicted deacylase
LNTRYSDLEFAGERIGLGESRDMKLEVSASFAGLPLYLPFRVIRAKRAGPTVFVTAAVHGDELNGTGIVRELMLHPQFTLEAGTLVLFPVVNMLGFERHTRYLPDRRDLNRSFPGSSEGSMARRYAGAIFEVLKQCDFGIDLHSAALRRTNFANVRADLSDEATENLAWAFGCELVVNSKGPKGSLRRSCLKAGCPTIILEAGEVWKIEPAVVEVGMRGVANLLKSLGMIEGNIEMPAYQAQIDKTKWVRAARGGLLQFHVSPGDVVDADQALATNSDLLGKEQNVLCSPVAGIVLGMTTLPAVKPGDPVCHIAIPKSGMEPIREALENEKRGEVEERLHEDLASSIHVTKEGE